ncbi:MAG TPA: cohesin domain-containing protein [Candidatus Limnocylindrales bacterium]
MNRSRLAALSAGAMFLVASVLVPATTLAAAPNDFSISAPSSFVSVVAGGSAVAATVTTVKLNSTDPAFTINLSVSGLPAGVTGSFGTSPVSAGSPSTLTISAPAGTALGSSTITVQGISTATPSYTHTATFTLSVLPSGTLSLNPSSVTASTGGTFSVDIVTQATAAMSGASASINFDQTKLQIVSVTKGADWNTASSNWVFPSAATIATANSVGHLPAIAAFFNDGTSLPANTNAVLAHVTFFASAAGSSSINLPTAGSDAGVLLDGRTASYGTQIATSSASPTATVTTTGSSGSTSANTNVTGTVDQGYVSLSCPTSETMPLVRNVNNFVDFTCAIGSNTTWTLTVLDQNSDPATHGYMRDTTQGIHLHDALYTHFNKHVVVDPVSGVPTTVYDTDVNMAGGTPAGSAQTLATGQNNLVAPLTFTQMAEPNDVAGNYGMSVQFTVNSTF